MPTAGVPNALIGGMVGPGLSQMYSSSDGPLSCVIHNIPGAHAYHVNAHLDEYAATRIDSIGISLKAGEHGPVWCRRLPMDEIWLHVDAVLGSAWGVRSEAARIVGELEQLPVSERRKSPHIYVAAAWKAREAERAHELDPTKPTVNEAVRKFFGYSATSKSNVTHLLNECRRRNLLPPKAGDSPEVVTASEALHDTVSAEEFEARTFVQVLARVAQQGGAAGHYAAALLGELQRPSAEQPATLEVDVDGLFRLFPPLWPEDGSPPKPSALRGILNRVKEYQRAFDRFAVSHRNAPAEELVRLLAHEAARFHLVMSKAELDLQAASIREQQTCAVRIGPEHLLQ
ncbi:hypothetical protein [Streptomyces turgidiscabies]|uniref:hypothetical protein n=1 Tax=Streptomyces turgidiscabies TaxID=85558 RepID=UPI0038F5DE9B